MRTHALLLAASLALAACGGGSGSAQGQAQDNPAGDGAPGVPAPAPAPAPPPPVPPNTDAQPPTASLTSPANLADGLGGSLPLENGILTLSATATDNVGVTAVEFQLDGAPVGTPDTSAPYQASVDTTAYASGQHIVRARARDAAGNFSAWATSIIRFGGSITLPRGFTKNEAWITGLSRATAFAQAPDGRLFVAEQGGSIRVVKNGALQAAPFAQVSVDATGNRGLLGVALHPGFAANGWVYVYYTSPQGGAHNRLSRFVASPANGDVSTGTETVLLDLPPLSTDPFHNGGAVDFGPDGKLYVAVGDNETRELAQDVNTPWGKMLRFNEDGTIPGDNPFCVAPELKCAVWALGLRNPFTFAFDPASGRLHINDVGESTWEEINLGAPGANYGWPLSEGPDRVDGFAAPLFTMRHSDSSPAGSGPGGFITGFVVIGGAFYPRGGPFPAEYHSHYFFADYLTSALYRLDMANGNAGYSFARLVDRPVDMFVGQDGALFVLTRGAITRISAP